MIRVPAKGSEQAHNVKRREEEVSGSDCKVGCITSIGPRHPATTLDLSRLFRPKHAKIAGTSQLVDLQLHIEARQLGS
jgi:hypothetical protein